MANSTPQNPLFRTGGTAGNYDIAVAQFGQEVLAAYERAVVMRDKHRVFNLNGTNKLVFPVVGRTTGQYHVAGTEITGGQIGTDKIELTSDDKFVASVFLSDIQEIMTHYDARSEYGRQLAEALAVQYDTNVMRALIKSARANAPLSGPVAAPIVEANAMTDAAKLIAAIRNAKQKLDENGVRVDLEETYALVKTAQWYLMANSDPALNRDYNGGEGSLAKSVLKTIDGVNIIKSNLCPWVDDRANTAIPDRYRIAMNTSAAVVWHKDAVATAEVQGIGMQTVDQPEKQGTLVIARQMHGTDIFRAGNAVEIRTGAPAST